MARDYARIMTAIWKNREFRELTEQQQRAYLFLVTQPDISAAGVLPLRVRRWADCASTSTPDGLAQLFKELEAGRFIVVDWGKEELLIRSFIRWDGGFNNPKRLPVIIRAAEDVESELIAHHVAMEFKRCGIAQPPPDGPSGGAEPPIDSAADRAPDSLSKINRVDLNNEPFPQVNSLSDSASTNHGRVPQPTTLNPQPIPPTAGAEAPGVQLAVIRGGRDDTGALFETAGATAVEANAGHVMAAWVEAVTATGRQPTKDQRGKAAKDIKQLLDAGNPPDVVMALARAAGSKCRATIANESMPGTSIATPPRESTTDARVRAGLALAAKYAAQEVG